MGDDTVSVKKLIPYIRSKLDSFWDMRVGHKFKEDKMFEGNLDIIKEELLLLYPLIKCRRDLFERKQSDSELASSFLGTMACLADEANLGSLRVEELMCHIAFCNLSNKTAKAQKLCREIAKDKTLRNADTEQEIKFCHAK